MKIDPHKLKSAVAAFEPIDATRKKADAKVAEQIEKLRLFANSILRRNYTSFDAGIVSQAIEEAKEFGAWAEYEAAEAKAVELREQHENAAEALRSEVRALRTQIGNEWLKRRTALISEIARVLKPYCSSAENALEAVDLCSGPRDLYGRFCGVSYSATEQTDPLAGAREVLQAFADLEG